MSTASPADPTADSHSHAARVAGLWAPESVGEVLGRVRSGASSAAIEGAAALGRAAAYGRPASEGQGTTPQPADAFDPVWIDRLPPERVAEDAVPVDAAGGLHLPLAGVPVAIKGNIDVTGLPTTAACPSFAAAAAVGHAAAVQRLVDAGAVIIGTTNLDQFATGLNGTRSPYGAPHAAGLPGRISGGSSSGSAVAVARGDVPLALGTDTAGSGRVPAALNAIVGLKPSKGLVSAAGVLPACRSLDVVSVFAADVDSAALALTVLAGPDPADAWSRTGDGFASARTTGPSVLPPRTGAGRALRLGVPAGFPEGTQVDDTVAAAWEAALTLTDELADEVELVPIDLAAFFEAGAMLYGSAFVAERYASVGAFIASVVATDPGDPALDPTVRDLVLAGASPSAADAFAAIDRIRTLTAEAHAVLATVDALFTPTVLEHPTHRDLAADPVGANARLGLFTTFGNLLDLAVLALPAPRRADGLPFGVSFHGPAFTEPRMLELGARFEAAVREAGLPIGPAGSPTDGLGAATPPTSGAGGRVLLAVGGAHMAGLPLNHELTAVGGEYLRLTRSSPDYVLHVLDTPLGPRPGIERVGGGAGSAADAHQPGREADAAMGLGVEIEIWSLPSEALGEFVHRVPPHLALGPITLLDGSTAIGFLGAASDTVTTSRLVPSWRHFARGL